MAITVPDTGEAELLLRALNKNTPDNCILKLFQSNTTPGESTVVGDLTEATFTGYAAKTLTGANWAAPAGVGNYNSSEVQEFTSSAGSQNQNIYGYYVTNTAGTVLLWLERFSDGPYNIANNGDKIQVTPAITLS